MCEQAEEKHHKKMQRLVQLVKADKPGFEKGDFVADEIG